MITEKDLLKRTEGDVLSTQFLRFVLDDLCPSQIPDQHDENTTALLLLRSVANNDRQNAIELVERLSKRQLTDTPVWVNNDLLFVSLAIAAIKFNVHREFVRSAAEVRLIVSAGGSHKGLAQAVFAAMTDNPDFTESAAIFSIVLMRYVEKYSASAKDILHAYNSLHNYDWDADHTPVSQALALRGFREILTAVDLSLLKGSKAEMYAFGRDFPKKIGKLSKVIALFPVLVMAILFSFANWQSPAAISKWSTANKFLISGLGLSSLWAILSLFPRFQKVITKAMLRLYRYPKVDENLT